MDSIFFVLTAGEGQANTSTQAECELFWPSTPFSVTSPVTEARSRSPRRQRHGLIPHRQARSDLPAPSNSVTRRRCTSGLQASPGVWALGQLHGRPHSGLELPGAQPEASRSLPQLVLTLTVPTNLLGRQGRIPHLTDPMKLTIPALTKSQNIYLQLYQAQEKQAGNVDGPMKTT